MATILQITARPYDVEGDPEEPDFFIVIRPDGSSLQVGSTPPVDGVVQSDLRSYLYNDKPIDPKFVVFVNPDGTPFTPEGIDTTAFLIKTNNLSDLDDIPAALMNLNVYSIAQVDTIFTSYYTALEVNTALNNFYTAAQVDALLAALPRGVIVVTDATAARVASAADVFKYIRFTNVGAVTYTFEEDNDIAVNGVITVRDAGTTSLTIVAGAGVTINPPFSGTLVSAGSGATIQIVKVAANEYDVFGHVGAA